MESVYVCLNCTDPTTRDEDVFATSQINDEVTFAKIIATVFIPTFPHCVPADNRDGWSLCPTCASILTQLYKNFQDFVNLTKEEGLLYGAYFDKKTQTKVSFGMVFFLFLNRATVGLFKFLNIFMIRYFRFKFIHCV